MADYQRELDAGEITEFYFIHCVARCIGMALRKDHARAVRFCWEAIWAHGQVEMWKRMRETDHPG
jgi:hypothetical protein